MSLKFTFLRYIKASIFRTYWIWIFLGLSSCGEQDEYVINVDLKSNHFLEGKKVYLGEQATKIFLDSAIVKNGKFQFRSKISQNFTPFEASLLYETGNKNYPFWLLGYKNPYRQKTYMSQFYIDKGVLNLVIDTSSKSERDGKISFIFSNINKQTEATYRHWDFDPAIANTDKSKDSRPSIIKKFPTSQHLLRQIDLKKSQMKDSEVKGLLKLFDESVHSTPIYKKLVQYTNYHYSNGNEIPYDITVFDSTLLPTKLKIDSTKYNLIVFWASWCGPCRQEIPQLTDLYNTHKKDLNIQSISIDQNEKAWINALKRERMRWPQILLKRDSSFIKFDKKYNLGAIPLSLLFDSEGKLVSRQLGIATGKEAIDYKIARLISGK